jgi:hypothetical protein
MFLELFIQVAKFQLTKKKNEKACCFYTVSKAAHLALSFLPVIISIMLIIMIASLIKKKTKLNFVDI